MSKPQQQSIDAEKRGAKEEYHAPTLVVYGELRELTAKNKSSGLLDSQNKQNFSA
jgi:hypothetical protein